MFSLYSFFSGSNATKELARKVINEKRKGRSEPPLPVIGVPQFEEDEAAEPRVTIAQETVAPAATPRTTAARVAAPDAATLRKASPPAVAQLARPSTSHHEQEQDVHVLTPSPGTSPVDTSPILDRAASSSSKTLPSASAAVAGPSYIPEILPSPSATGASRAMSARPVPLVPTPKPSPRTPAVKKPIAFGPLDAYQYQFR